LWLREEGAIGIAKAFIGSQFIHFLLGLPYFVYKKILPLELLVSPRILILWTLPLISFISSAYVESVLYRLMIMALIFIYILATTFALNAGRRQKLSATPDLSGRVLPCLITNSALKNAPISRSVCCVA
ncbi:hypothetical protein, partial [Enterococcus faecium]